MEDCLEILKKQRNELDNKIKELENSIPGNLRSIASEYGWDIREYGKKAFMMYRPQKSVIDAPVIKAIIKNGYDIEYLGVGIFIDWDTSDIGNGIKIIKN